MDDRWGSLRFPPPSLLLHARPALLLLLGAVAAFWSMQRNTAPEGGTGVKIVPCSLLGPCFSRRELWPSGLVRTYFGPPVLGGGPSSHDLV